jgi:hypothetical protein
MGKIQLNHRVKDVVGITTRTIHPDLPIAESIGVTALNFVMDHLSSEFGERLQWVTVDVEVKAWALVEVLPESEYALAVEESDDDRESQNNHDRKS